MSIKRYFIKKLGIFLRLVYVIQFIFRQSGSLDNQFIGHPHGFHTNGLNILNGLLLVQQSYLISYQYRFVLFHANQLLYIL